MMTDYLIGQILVCLFVAVCGILDYKYMEIDIRVFIVSGAGIIAFYVCMIVMRQTLNVLQLAIGLIPGCAVLAMSLLSNGGIGLGDAVFFIMLGLMSGCLISSAALILAVLTGSAMGVLMNIRSPGLNRRMPLLTIAMPYAMLFVFAMQEGV